MYIFFFTRSRNNDRHQRRQYDRRRTTDDPPIVPNLDCYAFREIPAAATTDVSPFIDVVRRRCRSPLSYLCVAVSGGYQPWRTASRCRCRATAMAENRCFVFIQIGELAVRVYLQNDSRYGARYIVINHDTRLCRSFGIRVLSAPPPPLTVRYVFIQVDRRLRSAVSSARPQRNKKKSGLSFVGCSSGTPKGTRSLGVRIDENKLIIKIKIIHYRIRISYRSIRHHPADTVAIRGARRLPPPPPTLFMHSLEFSPVFSIVAVCARRWFVNIAVGRMR